MRRYPQLGLSRAISSTKPRLACTVRGLPRARRGSGHRRLTRSACHRSRVRGGNDQAYLPEMAAGQQPGQRGQDRPVSPGQPRWPGLPLEYRDLMAQDEDLGVLSVSGPGEQGKPAEYAEHR